VSDRATQFREFYGKLRIADQRRFYEERRDEYAVAHRQAILLRGALLLGAAVAGVTGQLTTDAARAACAVTAAVLAALAAALTAFETLIGFPQLRKLYDDAAFNLASAEIDWTADPDENVSSAIERVEQIFRDERGQWGQLAVASEAGPTVGAGQAGAGEAGGGRDSTGAPRER
jgi:hypothetical protein